MQAIVIEERQVMGNGIVTEWGPCEDAPRGIERWQRREITAWVRERNAANKAERSNVRVRSRELDEAWA